MFKHCDSCKFWVKPMPGEKPDIPTGVCGLLSDVNEYGMKDYRINFIRGPHKPLAWMTNSNGYFRTMPNFSCAMWEKKE